MVDRRNTMTKSIPVLLLVCFYVHSVICHGTARSLMTRGRGIRSIAPPIQPVLRLFPPLRPFHGVPRTMTLHKKYKNMLRMRASNVVVHMLQKKTQFMKKPRIIMKGPRFSAVRPLGPQAIFGGVRGFGRRPLPIISPRGPQMQRALLVPMFSNPRQMPNIQSRPIVPAPRFRDDFFDFDNDDLKDRRDYFKRFEKKDNSFESGFDDGFRSAGQLPIRPIDEFRRSSMPAFSSSRDMFELGVASSIMSVDGPVPNVNLRPLPRQDSTGTRFRGMNKAFPQRLPDFDDIDDRSFNRFSDGSLNPRVPEFIDNVLDNQEDFVENIRDDFKSDGSFPVLGADNHGQTMPVFDGKRDDGVTDVLERDNKQIQGTISGFEMLGSRQREGELDIRDILKDNPFQQLGDPVLLDQISDDSDKSSDDSPTGTFALLGIDPGSVQPFQRDDKAIGVAPSGQDVSRSGSASGLPVDWAMDFGLTVDQKVKKEAISKVKSPSSYMNED